MIMQNLIVALIVFAAVAYAVLRFTPATVKRKLARMLGASEERARKVSDAGACGSCSSCKGCATPAEKNGQPMHLHK